MADQEFAVQLATAGVLVLPAVLSRAHFGAEWRAAVAAPVMIGYGVDIRT